MDSVVVYYNNVRVRKNDLPPNTNDFQHEDVMHIGNRFDKYKVDKRTKTISRFKGWGDDK